MSVLQILLPAFPNLLVAATPIALLAKPLRGFQVLFAPDFSRLALLCGSFATGWSFVHTGLILRTLRQAREALL
jgi:hypothetical protein